MCWGGAVQADLLPLIHPPNLWLYRSTEAGGAAPAGARGRLVRALPTEGMEGKMTADPSGGLTY